ncbi:MAG: transcription antitermination factor NusB [Planctomycetaceae bacterium]
MPKRERTFRPGKNARKHVQGDDTQRPGGKRPAGKRPAGKHPAGKRPPGKRPEGAGPPRGRPPGKPPAHKRPAEPPAYRAPTTFGRKSPRQVAIEVLLAYGQRGVLRGENVGPNVSQLLDDRLQTAAFSPADRGLATELVFGTVRRRATVDAILKGYVQRPREDVQDGLWELLRLGVYQLVLMSAIPPHAAIHETVGLAELLGSPQWKGFINGVLRNISRELTDEFVNAPAEDAVPVPRPDATKPDAHRTAAHRPESATPPVPERRAGPVMLADLIKAPAAPTADAPPNDDSVEVSPEPAVAEPDAGLEEVREVATPVVSAPTDADGDQSSAMIYRKFRSLLFPNPEERFAEYVAGAFSYPDWLVDRWLARYEDEEVLRLANWFNQSPSLTLRTNLERTTRERLLQTLRTSGARVSVGGTAAAIQVESAARVIDLPGFHEGWFSVQDESAQAAVELLDPQPGERILDLCAAPGGKATYIAERLAGTGEVVACDVQQRRLDQIDESISRLRLSNIRTQLIDAESTQVPDGPFDAALVDVPCSNTGVLGKRADVRWRIGPSDLRELPRLQQRLLERAISLVKSGGRVVYSTCSLEPEENRGVVDQVLAANRSLRLVSDVTHAPGQPGDGAYQALLLIEG